MFESCVTITLVNAVAGIYILFLTFYFLIVHASVCLFLVL